MNTEVEEKIYSFAKENNIAVGIGSGESFESLRPLLVNKKIPFAETDIEKRINPSLSLSDVKSIICIGMSYNKEFTGKKDAKLRGIMSQGAIGEDYHIVLRKYLSQLLDYIGITGNIYVDTGPLVDREVALRCGIGNYGNNHSILSPLLGAAFFIGYALTSVQLAPTPPVNEKICISCNRCILSCPSAALTKDSFDYKKCISYLTQLKGCLSDEQMTSIGINIYGCDLCQKVCPLNTAPKKISNIEIFYPDIEKLLNLSNKEFNETYRKTASGWRGKKLLHRNALIALGNIRDKSAIPLVKPFLNDAREDISYTAKWAYEKIIR